MRSVAFGAVPLLQRGSVLLGVAFDPLRVELFDLQPCVKLLRNAKNWRTDCTGLRAEIVRFVREELDCSPRADELNLLLS